MTPRKVFRSAVLGIALTATAGCSALSSLDTASKPLNTFELSPLPPGSVSAARSPRHLEVAMPSATGALTSDRIIVKPTPLEVQSLPEARWVNETTQHVQLLLVRSLANSGRFALVTAAGTGPAPDYVLMVDLQSFQAEVRDGSETVEIRTTMTLLRDTDDKVIASRSFNNSADIAGTLPADAVAAFDQAMTQQLKDVVEWLVRKSG